MMSRAPQLCTVSASEVLGTLVLLCAPPVDRIGLLFYVIYVHFCFRCILLALCRMEVSVSKVH